MAGILPVRDSTSTSNTNGDGHRLRHSPNAMENNDNVNGFEQWETLRNEGKELSDVTEIGSNPNEQSRNIVPKDVLDANFRRSKQITSAPEKSNRNTDHTETNVQNENIKRTNGSFAEIVDEVHPSLDELEELLLLNNDAYVIDPSGEMFSSIPNLVYSRVDEEGNIVGSERNTLHAHTNYKDEPSERICDDVTHNLLNSSDTATTEATRIPSERCLDDLITESHTYDYSQGSDSRRSRSCSESQINRHVYYNPRRLGGRQSRYTWYRIPRKKMFLRRDSSGDADSVTSFSLWSTSRREKAMLCCFSLLNLSCMMCISLFAPFFPQEAEWKGVSATVVGWVFGSYSLTQLFSSPIFGKMLLWVDAKFMFCAGTFYGGCCFALFGCVTYIPSSSDDNVIYIFYCFLLRMNASLGCSAAGTASFALTANHFRAHATTVFGLLETFSGIGLSLGPAIGGALYDLGGFVLPFVVLGGVMVSIVPVSVYLLPHIPDDGEGGGGTLSMSHLVRIPAILVTCFCVTMGGLVWAMLDPILQPHLAQFNVSASTVGLFFLLMCSLYAICSPVWGKLCDRLDDSSPMMLLGLILSGVGLLLLGPSTILGFSESFGALWLNIVALIVLGIAVSLAVIPTFNKMLDAADKAGLKESLELYGLIAGLWGAVYALGDFTGPVLGGFLTEKIGFKKPWLYCVCGSGRKSVGPLKCCVNSSV